MMNVRRRYSLISLVAAFLMMAAGTACVEPIDVTPPEMADEVELSFQIALPTAEIMTKAYVAAVDNESMIYDLQIWAFKHGGDAEEVAVGYTHPAIPQEGWADPSAQTITMKFRSAFINSDSPKVDFYVLANGPSVELADAKSKKRSELQEALITGFGATPVTKVPDKGLPMVAYFDKGGVGFDLTFLRYGFTSTQLDVFKSIMPSDKPDSFSAAQWAWAQNISNWRQYACYEEFCPKIELKRAVAKIRFVFAKAANMSATTEITSISINSVANATSPQPMLPASTYLFPRETGSAIYPDGTAHEAFSWDPLVPATSFKHSSDAAKDTLVDTPLRLRKDSETESEITSGGTKKAPKDMSAQEYETFLNTEIVAKHALERILYLRESDKENIYARIHFKIGGTPGTADIPIPTNEKLSRNTWWTVYAYFISYELGFQVSVMPWDGIGSSPNTNSHMQ